MILNGVFNKTESFKPYQDNSPRQLPPGQLPPANSPWTIAPKTLAPRDNYPLDNYPQRQIAPQTRAPRIITPWTIPPTTAAPPDNCPLSIPLRQLPPPGPLLPMAARAAILKSHSVNFMENHMSDFWGDLEKVSFRKWPRSDLQYRCNIRQLEMIFRQFQGKLFFILIFSMYVRCDYRKVPVENGRTVYFYVIGALWLRKPYLQMMLVPLFL